MLSPSSLLLLLVAVSLFSSSWSTALCRSRGGKLLAAEAFGLETCFLCYFYMPANQFVDGRKWTRANVSFASPALTDGQQTVSDSSNFPSGICSLVTIVREH
jgi:hypothetical protein